MKTNKNLQVPKYKKLSLSSLTNIVVENKVYVFINSSVYLHSWCDTVILYMLNYYYGAGSVLGYTYMHQVQMDFCENFELWIYYNEC